MTKASDAETVEQARVRMQRAIDRALPGGEERSLDEMFEAMALGKEQRVVVAQADVREIGYFDLKLPNDPRITLFNRRHWVYRDRRADKVYILSYRNRLSMVSRGYAEILAFRDDDRRRS